MAFGAGTCWEVQTVGSDANGGGFDPSNTSMATDLAATSGTGNSPVVTSASYNFIARDVGAWLFIKAGTNWLPGWYQIASVSANAATLTATIGAGVLFSTLNPTTVAGVATTASPTGGTWSIDYSQGIAPTSSVGILYTDLLILATTTNYTSAANPVGPNVVGNIINVTSGVTFTIQRVQILSVSGTTATCDKSLGTAAAAAGNGALGGCLLTPGMASSLMGSGGNSLWIKSGTYTITSASTNVANGCLSLPVGSTFQTKMIGYGSVRGDSGTKPLLQASGISTFILVTVPQATTVENVSFDGASLTSSKGISLSSTSGRVYRCKFVNFSNNALSGTSPGNVVVLCEATTCSATAFTGANFFFCAAYANTGSGFSQSNGTGTVCIGCISANNTGTSDGFSLSSAVSSDCLYCVAYGNGRDGFRTTAGAVQNTYLNCLAVSNTGVGFNSSAAHSGMTLINCAGYGNSSDVNTATAITSSNVLGFITLTVSPFNNAAGNDFSLNNTVGGGLLCRNAGIPAASGNLAMPGISTAGYQDVGAMHHTDLPKNLGIRTGGIL